MRVSKLLKELNLSFDRLKLYEPYLDVKIESINQKLSDVTRLKILSVYNNRKIQDKISKQEAVTSKKRETNTKRVRITKSKKEKPANKTEKFVGSINWYYNRNTQEEYGFLNNSEIGDVHFRGEVVIGADPHNFFEGQIVIFEIPQSEIHSNRKRALKLYEVEEEKDVVFLISNGCYNYSDFLENAINLLEQESFILKEKDKKEIEELITNYFVKEHANLDLSKIKNLLILAEKLDVHLDFKKFKASLSPVEKFELLKNTGISVELTEVKDVLLKYVLETVHVDFTIVEKLKPEEKTYFLQEVYKLIIEEVKVENAEKVFSYLIKSNINIDYTELDGSLIIKLWFASVLDFFPVDALYNKLLEYWSYLSRKSGEVNIDKQVKFKIDSIFNFLSEEESRELFFKGHYEIDKIYETTVLHSVLEIIKNTKYEHLKEEFQNIIFGKSSEFIKLYLFVEDYTDELNFDNAIIYTGLLPAEKQKIFFKKVLMLIETKVLRVGLEELSKITTFSYQENEEAKKIDGVGLDFTLSIILKIANDLKNNTITNQKSMFEIIANQIKTPQDFLEINGFFNECTGRTLSEPVSTGQGEEKTITYITKKTDLYPRFSTFCDGRKAIHAITGEPVLSNKESLEFWWCENSPCFEICRGKTIPENWSNYTLEDVLRILDVNYDEHQYEIILAVVNRVNRFLEHLKCTSCKSILKPKNNSKYSFYRVSEFSCTNIDCESPDKDIYLNHCLNGNCVDIIDSRTTVQCKPKVLDGLDNKDKCGWYICNNCLSCCSTEKLQARKNNKERFGYSYNCHTVGHRDLGIICCPKCGTETQEKKVDVEKYNKLLEWFKSKVNTDIIENSGQRVNGKWWFRWRQGNLERHKFKNALLQLKNVGFQVPNYNTHDKVQFISEPYNELNTLPTAFECGNCSHVIDLNNHDEFDISRVKAVKSFHKKIFPEVGSRN